SLAVTVAHFESPLRVLDQDPASIPGALYAAAGLLLAAVGLALFQSRARLAPAGDGLVAWQATLPGVAVPPPGSGVILVQTPLSRFVIFALTTGAFVVVACLVAFT